MAAANANSCSFFMRSILFKARKTGLFLGSLSRMIVLAARFGSIASSAATIVRRCSLAWEHVRNVRVLPATVLEPCIDETRPEFGRTDDYCYNIVENPVHIRDMNATILHQLGIDHNRLTFRYQGLDQKLTGAEPARVVDEILA